MHPATSVQLKNQLQFFKKASLSLNEASGVNVPRATPSGNNWNLTLNYSHFKCIHTNILEILILFYLSLLSS